MLRCLAFSPSIEVTVAMKFSCLVVGAGKALGIFAYRSETRLCDYNEHDRNRGFSVP